MQRIRLLRSFLFGQGIRGHVSMEDSVDDRVYPSTQREQIRLKGKRCSSGHVFVAIDTFVGLFGSDEKFGN